MKKVVIILGIIAVVVLAEVIYLPKRKNTLQISKNSRPSPTPTTAIHPSISPSISPSITPSSLPTKHPTAQQITDKDINQVIDKFLSEEPLMELTSGKSEVFCAHYLYGWDKDKETGLIHAYTWVYCQEYTYTPEMKLEKGVGISEPILFVLEKQGDTLGVQSPVEPGNGSNYVPSIKKMFPPKYAQQAINNQPDIKPLREEVEKKVKEYYLD